MNEIMEKLKAEALKNLENFLSSTPKQQIIERLNELSKNNTAGPKVSEIMAGCFDENQNLDAVLAVNCEYYTTSKFYFPNRLRHRGVAVQQKYGYSTFIMPKETNKPAKQRVFLLCLRHGAKRY